MMLGVFGSCRTTRWGCVSFGLSCSPTAFVPVSQIAFGLPDRRRGAGRSDYSRFLRLAGVVGWLVPPIVLRISSKFTDNEDSC